MQGVLHQIFEKLLASEPAQHYDRLTMPKRTKATKAEAGRKGGLKYARSHTPEERAAQASLAARARWDNRKLKAAA